MAKQSGYLKRRQEERKRAAAAGAAALADFKDQWIDDICKMMVVAMNDEGLGNIRIRRILKNLEAVTEDWHEMAKDDEEAARERLTYRVNTQILKDEPIEVKLRY